MYGNSLTIADSIFISIFSMIVVFLVLLIISYMVDIVAFVIMKAGKSEAAAGSGDAVSGNVITAPLQGKLQTLLVKVGDKVKAGDTIAIIEAMKMENDVPATMDGTVKQILVNPGDNVENGKGIVVL